MLRSQLLRAEQQLDDAWRRPMPRDRRLARVQQLNYFLPLAHQPREQALHLLPWLMF